MTEGRTTADCWSSRAERNKTDPASERNKERETRKRMVIPRRKREGVNRKRRTREGAKTIPPHRDCSRRGGKCPGNDLLSPAKDYHRPRTLNGRVRDGNGCIRPGMVTGSFLRCIQQVVASMRIRTSLLNLPPEPFVSGPDSCIAVKSEERVNAAKRSAVSIGQLRRSPVLHLRPIDLVVFQEPSPCGGRPDLAGGFTLRCLQRLSVPYVATQRCPERDNWHTSGTSLPILSY